MTEVHGEYLSGQSGFVWAELWEQRGFSSCNLEEGKEAKHFFIARVESTRIHAHRVQGVSHIKAESAFLSPNFPGPTPENLLEEIESKQNLLDIIQHRIHALWVWLNDPFHPSCKRTFNNLEPKYKS